MGDLTDLRPGTHRRSTGRIKLHCRSIRHTIATPAFSGDDCGDEQRGRMRLGWILTGLLFLMTGIAAAQVSTRAVAAPASVTNATAPTAVKNAPFSTAVGAVAFVT